jgi:hypothetical protein
MDAEINIKTTVHATVASFSNSEHTINRQDIRISQRGSRYVHIYFVYFFFRGAYFLFDLIFI